MDSLIKICFLSVLICHVSFLFSQDFSEVQKIVTQNRRTENFGSAVAISGQFAAISSHESNGKNSVYIFQKNSSGMWMQIQEIISPDNRPFDAFGYSIDMDKDYLIIGDFANSITSNPSTSFGAAYIYKKDINNQWVYISKLLASDRAAGDFFGWSVSIKGKKCLVGATHNNSNDGAIYVFEEDINGVWIQTSKVQPTNINYGFLGYTQCLSDSIIIAGALRESRDEIENNPIFAAGAAYVYELNSSGVWIQRQKIVAFDRKTSGHFGSSIAVEGDIMMINSGSYQSSITNNYFPACGVYIYEKNAFGIWEFKQKLTPPDPNNHLGFSNLISLHGDYLAVAAIDEREDNNGNVLGLYTGAVYIYKRQANGFWDSIQRIVSSDIAAGDYFGRSLAMEGNQLIIGAFQEDEDENGQNTIDRAGSAYVFELCPPVRDTISQTMCDSYQWQGNTYTQSGMYEFTTIASTGCDSIITLELTILPHSTSESSFISCTPYTWNATTYTQSGTYTYQTISSNGCDSIATLYLTILNESESEEDISVCDTYTWNGNTYTDSGTYTYQTLNAVGCDSTTTLHLTIYPSYADTLFVTTCDDYTWNGNIYTNDGIYSLQAQSTNGCDSISTLVLNIQNAIETQENITACDQYEWNGNTYTTSGTYTYQTISSLGCDSITTLNLEIFPTVVTEQTTTACDRYEWNGNTYTETGAYTVIHPSYQGCDSITSLSLTILPSTTSDLSTESCETYTWNGQTYTSSGIYTYHTTNHLGCDSTITLNLTIHNVSTSEDVVSDCESFTWNGNTYTDSGTYSYQTVNAAGCDSTAIINLTIHPTYQTSLTLSECEQVSYGGNVYTESGIYSLLLQSQFGCDSVIHLDVRILSQHSSQTETACDRFYWPVSDSTYTQSGQYEAVYTNIFGCDSIYVLNLEIFPSYKVEEEIFSCDTYYWPADQNTYTETGQYEYRTQSLMGCDSVFVLRLNIDTSFSRTDTVTTTTDYTWPVTQQNYTQSGQYDVRFTSVNGCDSTYFLILRIEKNVEVLFPNIILPGSDNGRFKAYSKNADIMIRYLSVYDRVASRVYHITNVAVSDENYGWDGTFVGKDVLPGVYVWMAEIVLPDGTTQQMTGDLTVIR